MKEKELRVESDIADDRAKTLGIDVRVASGCCRPFVSEERLHVAQVGSALVRRVGSRMSQRIGGNDRHPRALAGELDAGVERLVGAPTSPHQQLGGSPDRRGADPS